MKRNSLNKLNVSKILFYFAYSLICFNYMSSSVLFMKNYHKLLAFFSVGCLFIIFLIQSNLYKKKSLLFIFIALSIGLLSYIISGDNALIIIVLLVISSKKINFNKVVKFDLIIKIIFILIILLLYKFGETEYITRYRDDGTRRLAMGFGHPNVFGAYLYFVCMNICYLWYKKMNIFHYLIIIICLYISHFICNSRSAEISILLLLIVSIFSNFFEKTVLNRKLLKYMPFFMFIISMSLVQMYLHNNSIALYIDNLLNKRIFYSAIASNNIGFTLFGSKLLNVVKFGLDNAYLNTYYQYGVIAAITLFYCIYRIILSAQKFNNFKLIMVVFVFLIYAMMEKFSFHIEYNIFLLSISNLVFLKLRNNDERNEYNE